MSHGTKLCKYFWVFCTAINGKLTRLFFNGFPVSWDLKNNVNLHEFQRFSNGSSGKFYKLFKIRKHSFKFWYFYEITQFYIKLCSLQLIIVNFSQSEKRKHVFIVIYIDRFLLENRICFVYVGLSSLQHHTKSKFT